MNQLELPINELSDFDTSVWHLEPYSGFDACELPQFLRSL